MEAKWRAFLAHLTAEAKEIGHLRSDLDVDQFVWEICAIYLGHHASYRFVGDPLATERALRAFEALLDRSGTAEQPLRKAAHPKQVRAIRDV